jgi:co-chaperonin GroES (HSP10)
MKYSFSPTEITSLRPLQDSVLVAEMQFKERITSSGLVLPSDDGKGTGIRPRWGKVYAVGAAQKMVSVGQWVCVAHGRWTRGIDIEDQSGVRTIRKIDPNDILLVSDEEPSDDTMSDAIHVDAKSR